MGNPRIFLILPEVCGLREPRITGSKILFTGVLESLLESKFMVWRRRKLFWLAISSIIELPSAGAKFVFRPVFSCIIHRWNWMIWWPGLLFEWFMHSRLVSLGFNFARAIAEFSLHLVVNLEDTFKLQPFANVQTPFYKSLLLNPSWNQWTALSVQVYIHGLLDCRRVWYEWIYTQSVGEGRYISSDIDKPFRGAFHGLSIYVHKRTYRKRGPTAARLKEMYHSLKMS